MISRQDGYVLRNIEGENYLLPYGQQTADQKRALTLNETGLFLWNALESPKEIRDLVRLFRTHYEIEEEMSYEELEKDVNDFLRQLIAIGVLSEDLGLVEGKLSHTLEIAGIKVNFYGEAASFSDNFAPFYIDETPNADQHMEVLLIPPPNKVNGRVIIRNAEMQIMQTDFGYVVVFHKMKNVHEAWMNKEGSYVRFYCFPARNDEDRENIFHAIRLFFLYLAQKRGLFAIHSASILYRDKAWLFSGHSGMGKSTHTALWKEEIGTPYLNGDLNLVGMHEGKPAVFGIPWCGTSGIFTTERQELGGIVLLGRAEKDEVLPMSEHEKVLRIMQRMISPTWSPKLLDKNLNCAKELAESIGVYHLVCTREPSAVYAIKEKIDEDLH